MKFLPAGRRVPLLATTIGAAVLAGSAASAAPPVQQPVPSKPAPPRTPALPVKADLDGDKLFDDFEARLADLGPRDRIEVLVHLSAPATSARVGETSRLAGGFAIGRRFGVVDAFSATVTKGQATALTRVPWVVHVEENARVRAWNDSTQSSFGVTKARADAPGLDGDGDGAPASYSKGDLVAAVIDTGIDAAHVELDGGKVIGFKDFVNGRTSPYDDNGHGTHVAATIAGDGAYAGVAPGAALVGVKVLDANGSGTMADVTAAIDWVVQNKDAYGIEAVNLSLGASGCADGSDTTSVAVNNAAAAGLVVAVAAGNDGPGTCTIGSPGAAAGAVTVGAMSDLGERGFGLASFSSRGPTADGRLKPDVVAPGVKVTSAQAGSGSGYVAYDGTSMATPFVAGVALLMKDANGALTPQQVKDGIAGTAVDFARGGNNATAGSTGSDIDYGHGRLDAYAALEAAGAGLASPPAMPSHRIDEGSLPGTGAYVDYKLDVTGTAFPVAATMIIPAITGAYAYKPDFDLYLYDPAGKLVARAESVYRQEQVAVSPATTGTYTLRIYSYSGSGSFFVDVSAPLVEPDTTSPAAPTGLVATGGEQQVSLDWADNGESDLAAYTVYREKSDGTWTKLASVATSAYTDAGLAAATAYTYRVTASDTAANESSPSAAVSATTTADTTAPASPTGLAAAAGDASVALDWANSGESDLAGYNVYRQNADGTWAKRASVTTSSYSESGLANGTAYTYRVTAYDAVGNESTASAEASATPVDATPPAAPSGLTATAGDATVALEWADNGDSDLAGYRVYRKNADGTWSGIASATASAHSDSGLVNGTTYSYRITAVDTTGNESSASAEASATPRDPDAATTKAYAPSGARILAGEDSNGSLGSLAADDGDRLEISKKGPLNVADYYAYTTISAAERSTLRKFTVEFDGHASHADVAMTLSIYDWRTGAWQVVDGPRTGVTADRAFTWSTGTAATDYVSSGGEVRFRVRGERGGGLRTRTDLIRFTVEY